MENKDNYKLFTNDFEQYVSFNHTKEGTKLPSVPSRVSDMQRRIYDLFSEGFGGTNAFVHASPEGLTMTDNEPQASGLNIGKMFVSKSEKSQVAVFDSDSFKPGSFVIRFFRSTDDMNSLLRNSGAQHVGRLLKFVVLPCLIQECATTFLFSCDSANGWDWSIYDDTFLRRPRSSMAQKSKNNETFTVMFSESRYLVKSKKLLATEVETEEVKQTNNVVPSARYDSVVSGSSLDTIGAFLRSGTGFVVSKKTGALLFLRQSKGLRHTAEKLSAFSSSSGCYDPDLLGQRMILQSSFMKDSLKLRVYPRTKELLEVGEYELPLRGVVGVDYDLSFVVP